MASAAGARGRRMDGCSRCAWWTAAAMRSVSADSASISGAGAEGWGLQNRALVFSRADALYFGNGNVRGGLFAGDFSQRKHGKRIRGSGAGQAATLTERER